jgi:sugar-specific transcriptional regulator TrmB
VAIITTNMTIYESLGLSPNEAKIYESLVEKGESSISEIAINAQIHRRNAYDAINRLVDKGLCFLIVNPKENRYNAVDPDKLSELLAERQNELNEKLPDLKKKFQKRDAPQEAYIYKGLEGQKNIWRDIIRVGEDSYFIGAKGGWFDSRLDKASRDAFFRDARKKGIKFIQLFDNEVKTKLPDLPKSWPGILQYRYLPAEYSTGSGIGIFGDYVVTYIGTSVGKLSPDDLTFYIVRSKVLGDSYRKWFQYMWNQSEEPRKK